MIRKQDNLSVNWISKTVLGLHRVGSRVTSELGAQLRTTGVDVLNIKGAPISPPGKNVIEAAQKAASENGSTPSRGLKELREAVCRKLKNENCLEVDPEKNVLITNGAQHALAMAILGVIESGDEVIIPTPAYFTDGIAILAGGIPVFAPMEQEEGFRLNASKIEEKITSKSKIIILTNPVNPTGYIATRDDLEAIAKIANKYNLLVISDESYEKIIFDGKKHISIASLEGMDKRTITVHSFSKSYAMAEWRVGYLFGHSNIITQVIKISEWIQLHGNYICQKAAAEALVGPQEWVEINRLDIENNRDLIVKDLSEIDKISFIKPNATPNIFINISQLAPDDRSVSDYLIKHYGVRTEPGNDFHYPGYLRIQFCATKETIKELTKRFSRAVEAIFEKKMI